MPELPEVETVRRGLEPSMRGAKILSVECRRDGLRFPFPENFTQRLEGRTIAALGRRAKYLLVDLDEVLLEPLVNRLCLLQTENTEPLWTQMNLSIIKVADVIKT